MASIISLCGQCGFTCKFSSWIFSLSWISSSLDISILYGFGGLLQYSEKGLKLRMILAVLLVKNLERK
jgi:hypothetical protein